MIYELLKRKDGFRGLPNFAGNLLKLCLGLPWTNLVDFAL